MRMWNTYSVNFSETAWNNVVNVWWYTWYTFTASQTWCLARYLPLLIGDLVPEKDANWEHYLHLMEMVDYILAPVTTMANIEYLRILIEDYLVEFRMLYPDSHLTPKCHYLIHVPSWMSKWVLVWWQTCYIYYTTAKIYVS